LALAGFGLIFIGIETLQEAMSGLSGVFDLASLPSSGLVAHALALLAGVVLTVVMQSSSAAVATTLTALHTGSVNFEQAASLVIGAAIGTTITGALAAIGGSVPAKRTALAHISFNLATGLIALLLLPLFLRGIGYAQEHFGLDPGATSLAAFHTAFIALGVLIFLPMVYPFSRLIERVLPEKESSLTKHLDNSLLHAPSVALEATRRALVESAQELFRNVEESLIKPDADAKNRATPGEALEAIRLFFARIPPVGEGDPPSSARLSQLHAMDHLTLLTARLSPPASLRRALADPGQADALARASGLLRMAGEGLAGKLEDERWLTTLEQAAGAVAEHRRGGRESLLAQTANGSVDPQAALETLDAMRWLDRVCYHAWRASYHLHGAQSGKRADLKPDTRMDEPA
jgi:phosphate:Na+ symporter